MEIYLSFGRGASDPYLKLFVQALHDNSCMQSFHKHLAHDQFSQIHGSAFSDGTARDAMARSLRLGTRYLMLNFKFVACNNTKVVNLQKSFRIWAIAKMKLNFQMRVSIMDKKKVSCFLDPNKSSRQSYSGSLCWVYKWSWRKIQFFRNKNFSLTRQTRHHWASSPQFSIPLSWAWFFEVYVPRSYLTECVNLQFDFIAWDHLHSSKHCDGKMFRM